MSDKSILARKSFYFKEEDDLSLRPKSLDEYIGQKSLKQNLKIYINAAKERQEVLDHILFFGPPGIGKTTLAYIVANEMGVNIRTISGPSLERSGDLIACLTSIEAGDIVFIDEIHRIPKTVEEVLYSAMEDYRIALLIGREQGGKVVDFLLPPFTLIGATTKPSLLSAPLRNRFGINAKLASYSTKEIMELILRSARVFKHPITHEAAFELAKKSRNNPRLANRYYKRVRDFATFYNEQIIQIERVKIMLSSLDVDEAGLVEYERHYLTILKERFNGGPVGIETLSALLDEEKENVEEIYESYLLQIGFIERTKRGRTVTKKGLNHLNGLKN
jgi:Holliday junction DNA helicase RuvB